MNATKKKKLEAAGFTVGSTQDFLKLSDEEMAYIEIKRSLSKNLELQRKAKKLTQVQAAKIIKTSQSRLAKMEHAEKSVSIDLLIRANLKLGTNPRELKKVSPSQDNKGRNPKGPVKPRVPNEGRRSHPT